MSSAFPYGGGGCYNYGAGTPNASVIRTISGLASVDAYVLHADDFLTLMLGDGVPDGHVAAGQVQLVVAGQRVVSGEGVRQGGSLTYSPRFGKLPRLSAGASSPGPGSAWIRLLATSRPTSRRSRFSSAFRASSSARGTLTVSDASAFTCGSPRLGEPGTGTKKLRTWAFWVEPPIGIEPMTYALRGRFGPSVGSAEGGDNLRSSHFSI